MRIRSRKNLSKKNTAIVLLFLLPIIGFLGFAGFFLYILYDVASYTYTMPVPNTDYFYDIEDINMTHLGVMAENYEIRLEQYNMYRTNMSLDVTFTNDNYDTIASYGLTDNANLHIGYTIASQCLKYTVAVQENNLVNRLNATRVLKKLVTALSLFMAAPNGGLGINPETGEWYEGTLARIVASPEQKDVLPGLFPPYKHYKHFNGTGIYSNWRVRLYTSRDELGGFYLSIASLLEFIEPTIDADSKWIYDRAVLLVKQMIEGFKRTNWLLLGGTGDPTGSDLNPVLEGSTWQLALCRMAATADPATYTSLYHYVLSKFLALDSAAMGGDPLGIIGGYYGYSFGLDVMLALIWLEDDPQLKFRYIRSYEEIFYPNTRYHRNTFHNMAHLINMEMLAENQKVLFKNPKYSDANIRWDVLDSLWRFKMSGWEEGIRNYNLIQRPHSTRSTSLNPDIAKKERAPQKKNWREFFDTHPLGPMFKDLIEIEWSYDQDLFLHPLSVSEYGNHHWVWEHGKLDNEGGDRSGNGLQESAPNSFICMYWMGRAYGIIPKT
jgi:hypothetical protein